MKTSTFTLLAAVCSAMAMPMNETAMTNETVVARAVNNSAPTWMRRSRIAELEIANGTIANSKRMANVTIERRAVANETAGHMERRYTNGTVLERRHFNATTLSQRFVNQTVEARAVNSTRRAVSVNN